MNKKGSAIIFIFMMAVVFFLLGLALTPVIADTAGEARAAGQLDCANESISDQNKAVCTQVDAYTPLYIGVIFGLAGMLLARVLI